MEKTLEIINKMQSENVIEGYAIGGAVAAFFYMEPILTYDLDVFIFLPQTGQPLVLLAPVYDYLKNKGYQISQEHIIIEGVPVQFIPAYNPLVEDAVRKANETEYEKIKTRILRVEHLVAIMLQTNRPKDRIRITQILDEAELDEKYLLEILEAHGLTNKWQEFRRRYYEN